MRNIFFLITVLISAISFSQNIEKIKLTPMGTNQIIVAVDSLKATEIYLKSLNWVQETYKNPDIVLKAKIENEKIRINGITENAWWYKSLGSKFYYDMEYSLEISFKDGKYKFQYTIGQFSIHGGQKVFFDYKSFFKKDGEVLNSYKQAIPDIEESINLLSNSFYNYVTEKKSKDKDEW